jgi:hypothetical protein
VICAAVSLATARVLRGQVTVMCAARADVTGTKRERFNTVMGFFELDSAKSYCIHPVLGLVLFWVDAPTAGTITDDATKGICYRCCPKEQIEAARDKQVKTPVSPLPFKMDKQGLCDFAWAWLQKGADYGSRPDTDGDSERGWRVYNEGWGHVSGNCYAIVAIQPFWFVYGK